MAKPQSPEAYHKGAPISREEIFGRLHDSSCAIVNVMPPESFASGHIPGSLNIPVAALESMAWQLLPNFDQEIAIYCAGPT